MKRAGTEFYYLDGRSKLGAIDAVQTPSSARTFAAVLVTMFFAIVVALAMTPWVQTSFAEGRVIAFAPLERQQNIEAPIEGRLYQWSVREGSHVQTNDVIAEIRDNDPEIVARIRSERLAVQSRIDAIQARVALLGSRVLELQGSRGSAVGAASDRVQMARNRVRAAQQSLVAAQASAETARLQFERQRALSQQGLSSTRTAELAQLDHTRALTEVDRARAALLAAQSEQSALRDDQRRTGTDLAALINDARASQAAAQAELANVNAELVRLDTRLARQSTMLVRAPRDGTILRLIANEGTDMVRAGEPIAVLVPDNHQRAVELWIDGNDVPLVQEGRHVRLQFEGWPAVQFSGWPSVAVGTFGGRIALVDATDNGRGKFRVVVVPDGEHPWPQGMFLRQGVRANGWVLLGRVSLGYELWRQFNGFAPTYAMEQAAQSNNYTPSATPPPRPGRGSIR
jgi:biotin carboxyl carrier protein